MISVQPKWMKELTLQQQSVLFLAGRGPDNIEKNHPCKNVHRAYRATIFIAAKHGKKEMELGEAGDSFMSLYRFSNHLWNEDIKDFIDSIDSLPLHYVMHIMHGAQILFYKHPDDFFKFKWGELYITLVNNFHLKRESEREMDERLCD